jgi:hypothetical protein
MFDFDALDMDFDGDVDRIDFLGFGYLMPYLPAPDDEACHEVKEEDEPQHDDIPWWF